MRRLRSATARLRSLLKQFCGWFSGIWARLIGEPGYAEAMAALAVAIVEIFFTNHRVRRLAREAGRTFTLLIRSLRANERGIRYDGYDDPDEGLSWT